jgi:CRP/FNR family transcriptional regulator
MHNTNAMTDAIPFHDPALREAFARAAVKRAIPAGTEITRPGDIITHIPVLIKGTLRIIMQSADGSERYLYHLFPGETCAMSLTCCRADKRSEVKAVVEDDAEMWMVPVEQVEAWMRFPEWNSYVANTHAQRFSELLEAMELVAFSRLDEQLWSYLLRRVQAMGSNTLRVTHQEIATELGSPREVVTRLLHQLQQRGRVVLGRNVVEVRPMAG